MAKKLDRHYIPSRYPNFHPEGAMLDYYTKMDAERAIKYAGEIVGFVRGKVLQTQLRSSNQRTQGICQKSLGKRSSFSHIDWIAGERRLYGVLRCGYNN